VMEGKYFVANMQAARDQFAMVRGLYDAGIGEWSYGYDVMDADYGEWAGQPVRFLKRQAVNEVSPVLQGAGVNTRTLAAKAALLGGTTVGDMQRALKAHKTGHTLERWAGIAAETVDALRGCHAWVDPAGDIESPLAYRFAHHAKADAPANLRQCIGGIGWLNSSASLDIAADREGVYTHLSQHVTDAGRQTVELKATPGANLTLADEIAAAMVVVSATVDAAGRVVAHRSVKGKALSQVNVELLDWLRDDLGRLNALLATPEDALAQQFALFVRNQQRYGGHQS
jgi:hypothetical protein